MQFLQLRGLTTLPVDRLDRQFGSEDVRAVLPVHLIARTTEALLVATGSALAIIVPAKASAMPWKVHWTSLEGIGLSDGTDPWTETFEDEYQLFVDVGRVRFESHLMGETGRRVLRDFVAAVWRSPTGARSEAVT